MSSKDLATLKSVLHESSRTDEMMSYDLFLSTFENRAVFTEKASEYARLGLDPATSPNFQIALRVYSDAQNRFTERYLNLFRDASYMWSSLLSVKFYLSIVRILAYEQMSHLKFQSDVIS